MNDANTPIGPNRLPTLATRRDWRLLPPVHARLAAMWGTIPRGRLWGGAACRRARLPVIAGDAHRRLRIGTVLLGLRGGAALGG